MLPFVPPALAAVWFTAPDSLYLVSFYGPLAAAAVFYHFWMLVHQPD
jgi:hypothetical protein